MARYAVRVSCTHPEGCREVGFYDADTRREEAEIRQRYAHDWRCVRHTRPDDVVSATNRRRSTMLEVVEHGGPRPRRYWSDGERTGSGFLYGPGFKAFAEDFPVGTKLQITAEVSLRDQPD